MTHRLIFVLLAGLIATSPAFADGFKRVDDRANFLDLVENRQLKRFGIKLQVTGGGEIRGKAFGQKVTGDWRWSDGYFCRDLFVGGDELGANCQKVEIKGQTMRFTSDKGAGIYADLRLH